MHEVKPNILIVDDDLDIRDAVSSALHEIEQITPIIDHSATIASAMKRVKATIYDIVILDLHLPDKSGFEFMDIARKEKNFTHTNVVMLTADDTLKNMFAAENRSISVYHFLSKPFNMSDLQAIVMSVCLHSK